MLLSSLTLYYWHVKKALMDDNAPPKGCMHEMAARSISPKTPSNRSHSFPDAQQYPAMPLPQPRCVKLAVENVERSRQIVHLSISN